MDSKKVDMLFRYDIPELPIGQAVTLDEMEKIALEQVELDAGKRETGLWSLTMIYNGTGRHQKAIECLTQLLRDNDDPEKRASCYTALGQTMEQMRDFAAACQYYRKARLHEPRSTRTWYYIHNNLGFSLNQLGEYEEALPFLHQAMKIAPYLPNAYKNIGMALEALGRYAGAATCYITATQVLASDDRSLGLLEAMVEAHPEILRDMPALEQRLEACRQAVRIAVEKRPDVEAHWSEMRKKQQEGTERERDGP